MEEYLRSKLEGLGNATSERTPDSADAFGCYSEEYVQGYFEGAREALESYGPRRATL